jgi:hypothetical protein
MVSDAGLAARWELREQFTAKDAKVAKETTSPVPRIMQIGFVPCTTGDSGSLYIQYPVRNFRCPFCGARMRTEEYKGRKPWTCPGCSRQLQFSETHGYILQLCFMGLALLFLYLLGIRGWGLLVGTLVGGFVLTVVFTGPLDRIIPPRLEPYRPIEWPKRGLGSLEDTSVLNLSPREGAKPEADQSTAKGEQGHA